MALLPYAIFLGGCLASAGLGVLLANWLWRRREERLREEAMEPFCEPIEIIDVPRPWISLGDAANNAVRAAAILRENATPQPLSEAAE
jgi:hypothetical protein